MNRKQFPTWTAGSTVLLHADKMTGLKMYRLMFDSAGEEPDDEMSFFYVCDRSAPPRLLLLMLLNCLRHACGAKMLHADVTSRIGGAATALTRANVNCCMLPTGPMS